MKRTGIPALVVLWACLCAAAGAEPRWRLQYFHDEMNSTLLVNDLKFPSVRRGLAVGLLQQSESSRPVMVSTNDGGATWSIQKLKDTPLSLFFLNDSLGWMVTSRGIWKTEEAGRSWVKVASVVGVLRVHFVDENRGFAVGVRKTLLETNNGGKSWAATQILEKVPTSKTNTVFAALDFLGGRFGLIAGWSRPPRTAASRFPDWMDPQSALKRREVPSTTVVIETRDGGVNWAPQVMSMFGRITQIQLHPAGSALSLVEFDDAFEWPSEVFHVDLRTGKSTRAYREKDRLVTNLYLDRTGTGYLAAIECIGTLRRSPIPGRLRILRSTGLTKWQEMDVDYRAVARRAILAGVDAAHIWVATDTGMILRLENE